MTTYQKTLKRDFKLKKIGKKYKISINKNKNCFSARFLFVIVISVIFSSNQLKVLKFCRSWTFCRSLVLTFKLDVLPFSPCWYWHSNWTYWHFVKIHDVCNPSAQLEGGPAATRGFVTCPQTVLKLGPNIRVFVKSSISFTKASAWYPYLWNRSEEPKKKPISSLSCSLILVSLSC